MTLARGRRLMTLELLLWPCAATAPGSTAAGDHPAVTLHGGSVVRAEDGTCALGLGEPFGWVQVGDTPIKDLEGTRSFTIVGWLNTADMTVGDGGGDLVIGNFNKTLQDAGLDRQFRGRIRGLQIYTSRLATRGALSPEQIRQHQRDR